MQVIKTKNVVIIDTDPGVDDALALMMAIKSGLQIEGITTVFGNSSIENTTLNALTILQLLDSNLPVYKGVTTALDNQSLEAKAHGENGLGGFTLPKLQKKEQKENAISFLINFIENLSPTEQLKIICLGPTTNLAVLAILRPDLLPKISQLVILGGVFNQKGNKSPVSEFNVINDPLALKISLALNVQKILIPINVCRQVIFTQKEFENISDLTLASSVQQITDLYIKYYQKKSGYGRFAGGVMYDLLAVTFALDPTIFQTSSQNIWVDIRDGVTKGQTILTSQDPNCQVIESVDVKKLKELFFVTMNN